MLFLKIRLITPHLRIRVMSWMLFFIKSIDPLISFERFNKKNGVSRQVNHLSVAKMQCIYCTSHRASPAGYNPEPKGWFPLLPEQPSQGVVRGGRAGGAGASRRGRPQSPSRRRGAQVFPASCHFVPREHARKHRNLRRSNSKFAWTIRFQFFESYAKIFLLDLWKHFGFATVKESFSELNNFDVNFFLLF